MTETSVGPRPRRRTSGRRWWKIFALCWKPVFAQDAIDITIVGDVTTDKAVQAVAATFGALPVRADRRTGADADNGTHLPAGGQAPIVTTGSLQAGQEILSVCWPTHGQLSDPRDAAVLDLLGRSCGNACPTGLRGQGIAYVSWAGSVSSKVFDYGFLQASAQLPPDKTKEFYDSIDTIAADLKAGRMTEDDLARARNPALQQLRRSRQTNAYWLSRIGRSARRRKQA